MKKILAILVALAMVFSLTACGEYKITVKEKDNGEKAAVDSVDEKENKGNKDNKPEKETEPAIAEVPEFTSDIYKNKELIEAYLSYVMDLKEYNEVSESDSIEESGSFGKRYGIKGNGYKDSGINFDIKIGGKPVKFPTNLATFEGYGFDFKNTAYNSDSEFNARTHGDISMKGADDKSFAVSFLNVNNSKTKLSDCIINGFDVDAYYDFSDYSINGITKNSSFEDVIAEFGTPDNFTYFVYDSGNTSISLYYYNYTDGSIYADEKLFISYDFDEGIVSSVSYEIPTENFQ